MSTDAFFAGMTFKVGNGAATEIFTALEELTDLSGFGEMLELIEVTHFGSGGSKEYIAGLADGKEITATCNHILDAVQQLYLRTNKGSKVNIQIVYDDGVNTETYDFAVVILGWETQPSQSDKNAIVFTFKISGGITLT